MAFLQTQFCEGSILKSSGLIHKSETNLQHNRLLMKSKRKVIQDALPRHIFPVFIFNGHPFVDALFLSCRSLNCHDQTPLP